MRSVWGRRSLVVPQPYDFYYQAYQAPTTLAKSHCDTQVVQDIPLKPGDRGYDIVSSTATH